MKIERIKVENFRCFKNLDLPIEYCHALVGENGAGKTSILEAINLATSSGQAHLNEQDFNNADLGDLSIEVIFDEPFLIRLPDGYTTQDIPCKSILLKAHRREKAAAGKAFSDSFVTEKFAVPIEYADGHKPDFSAEEADLRIPNSVTKTANGFESPRQTGSKFKFTSNRLTLQNETINFPNVFYFDRDREEQAKVGYNSVLQKVVKDLNWRYRKGWDQTDVHDKWNQFYNAVISTVETPKSERIIGPIKEKIKRVAGVDFADLELGLLEIEQPFSKAFFSRRDGTNQIDQRRFGSGISILLAYFLLETVSSLSKESTIFLIDEPELHLHPQLQKALFKEFQESKYQTIYTTQSDCFINIATWRSVTRFQKEFLVFPKIEDLNEVLDGKKLVKHLDEIKRWHQHQSIFFREDNQIFFSRKCLLVEGPAELYGIPILAQILRKDLNNITIISCNGKGKIPYYQLLCRSFHIPFFTLFDLDGASENQGDNQRPRDWADTNGLAMFSTSFEKLFGISGDHKTSDLLVKIDSITISDIPAEISTAIAAIETWASS
jgi:AAA15 family ATPase/GTPase